MSKQQDRCRPPATWRYTVNLCLFLVAFLLMCLWFHWHWYPIAKRVMVVGTPLSLLAVWKLCKSILPKGRGGDVRLVTDRIVSHHSATEGLVFAILAALFFLLTTSSIYVEHAANDSQSYEVSIERGGVELLAPMKLTSYERTSGRPFFLETDQFWRSREVVFKVTRPFAYEPVKRTMRMWSAVRVRVPTDFTPKKYRVGRIAPVALELLALDPRVDAKDRSSYRVELELDGQTYEFKNLLYETIYFGSHREVIEALISQEPRDKYFQLAHNYLFRENKGQRTMVRMGPADLRERARMLSASRRIQLVDRELAPGLPVRITVWSNENKLLEITAEISADTGIQTFFLARDTEP